MSLEEACKKAVESGRAKTVCGSAIQVTIQADETKFRHVEKNYGGAIEHALQEMSRQVTAAWKKLRREGPWYF
jgi:hypothetical protein